jgi:hypothetical protein
MTRQLLTALAAIGLALQSGTGLSAAQARQASKASCPPAVDRLVAAGAEFRLPSGCVARCQSGHDSSEADITCGVDRIEYVAAFPAAVGGVPFDRTSGRRPHGRSRLGGGELLWGTDVGDKPCAVLFLPMGKEQFAHLFCGTSSSVAIERLLSVARSYRVNRSEEARKLCPDCG